MLQTFRETSDDENLGGGAELSPQLLQIMRLASFTLAAIVALRAKWHIARGRHVSNKASTGLRCKLPITAFVRSKPNVRLRYKMLGDALYATKLPEHCPNDLTTG